MALAGAHQIRSSPGYQCRLGFRSQDRRDRTPSPTKLKTMKLDEVSASALRDDGQPINTDEMILIMRDEGHAKV
jgi:hypothetical protein